MDDLQMEKDEGFSWEYLAEVPQKKEEAQDRYLTPGFGLAAQLFASMAKVVLDRLGPVEGEALVKEAVDNFGMERGKRIAARVQEEGLPLTLKNWLTHTDIGSENFGNVPDLENGDLVVRVSDCTFFKAAEEWGLGEYAGIYCKYADPAILRGYNPDIKLVLDSRHSTGEDHCRFRYIMKEANK